MQRAARSPEAPSSCYCCRGCPGPGGRLSRLSWESRVPPAAHLFHEEPHKPRSHLHSRPRWVSSRRPDSHKLPPVLPTAVIVPHAPPTSTAPAARAPTPGLWLSSSGSPAAEGAAALGCACGRGARLLIPAGGGGGGGSSASARAGLVVAGRGPSHQRWRGAEGRAEQAGWVGSVLRVAMAASLPGRAPLARGGAAQSGRWPRPRPAPQPSARSPAPARDPPPPRRAGSEGGRAPPRTWAGPSAGGAVAPRSPSRGDRGRATAPSSVRALNLRAGSPRPALCWGQVRRGAARPRRPSPTRMSTPQICPLLGPAARARLSALRQGTERWKLWGVRCATRDTLVLLLWLEAM